MTPIRISSCASAGRTRPSESASPSANHCQRHFIAVLPESRKYRCRRGSKRTAPSRCQFVIQPVGDQHAAWCVRDANRGTSFSDDSLGSHTASPEYRQLIVGDRNRIAVIGPAQVFDTYQFGLTEV